MGVRVRGRAGGEGVRIHQVKQSGAAWEKGWGKKAQDRVLGKAGNILARKRVRHTGRKAGQEALIRAEATAQLTECQSESP